MFYMYQEKEHSSTLSNDILLADALVNFGQFLMILCEIADRRFGSEKDILASKLRRLIRRLEKLYGKTAAFLGRKI